MGGGGRQDRQPRDREGTQRFHQCRQPLSRPIPWATPTGPTARTPREHSAQPEDRPQSDRANHSGHSATDRPDERTSPGRPTQTLAREKANHEPRGRGHNKDRRQGNRKKKGGGGDRGGGQGDPGRNRQQWIPVGHNTKERKATPARPPPATDDGPPPGRAARKNTKAGNNAYGDPQTTLHHRGQRPSGERGTANHQGQRPQEQTGQAARTSEGPPAPHRKATHPRQGSTSRRKPTPHERPESERT